MYIPSDPWEKNDSRYAKAFFQKKTALYAQPFRTVVTSLNYLYVLI